MISLKRYLDATIVGGNATVDDGDSVEPPTPACLSLLDAYRSALAQIGELGAETCPSHGAELKRGIAKIDASISDRPSEPGIAQAKQSVAELLQDWGKKAVLHYRHRAAEVKDLLLVMARTAESLGLKDEQYAQQLDSVTIRLETIATLDDVSRIRTSVEESARELRKHVSRMTAENKAVIDHLRAEVSTYQAKLEKAEYIAS